MSTQARATRCELEIHALGNAFYDLERFGFRFVASPRHADVLLVTGPVTRNMSEALKRTYDADAGAQMGDRVGRLRGRRRRLRRQLRRRGGRRPTSSRSTLCIPGCPPSPAMLLKGLLALMNGRTRTG